MLICHVAKTPSFITFLPLFLLLSSYYSYDADATAFAALFVILFLI